MNVIESGTVLAGKYQLEQLIGRGGMGSVWRALHLGLHAPVAVKLLDQADFSGESLFRFNREARAAAAIRSPHVVQILDHGVDEGTRYPFIAMELLEGESLAQRLSRTRLLSPAEAGHVLTHVARALTRAHEAGIVHRDLKPDNVFLVRNEDEVVAKVLDFGIAKARSNNLTDSATRTGAVMGTPYYMSPEQISGARDVDRRTDLWAFGVMAFECLTGTRPFDAETIGGLTLRICVEPLPVPSTFTAVPAGFDAWFARSVNRDPERRFPSARDAADALRQICGGESSSQPPGPLAPTPAYEGAFPRATTTGGAVTGPSEVERVGRSTKSTGVLLGAAVLVAALAGTAWMMRRGVAPEGAAAPASATPVALVLPGPTSASQPQVTTDVEDQASPSPLASSPAAPPSALSATPTLKRAAPVPAASPRSAVVAHPSRPVTTPPAASAPPAKASALRDVIQDRH